ncbi:MAG TPA: NTP transferase domain-containing protein [Desulfobacterales bacterium]|nr:NTP transferase domain-containing protein [Desulfobacterales bacterium]
MKAKIAVIILAAGLGKRMRSPKAKVLHEILGRPMLSYVIDAARGIADSSVIVVVGNQAEAVRRAVSGEAVRYATQERQLGTGHAVLCALPQLPDGCEQVVVLCGDTPLLTAPTLKGLVCNHLAARRDATLLAVELDDPQGYGRLLLNDRHQVCGIVEEADASAGQRAIRLINTGIYCVTRQFLSEALPNVTPDNAQGEFYLTDIIRIGYESGRNIGVSCGAAPREILGVNTPEDLARVEALMAGRDAIIS